MRACVCVCAIFFHSCKNFFVCCFLAFAFFTLKHLCPPSSQRHCFAMQKTHFKIYTCIYVCISVCRGLYVHTIMVYCIDTWLQHNFCTRCNLQCFTQISATVATLSSAKLQVCRAVAIIKYITKYRGQCGGGWV